MIGMPEPDIFDYLAKQTVAGTTQSNLHDSVKSTNVDRSNIKAWQDAIMIAKAIEDSRTFARGLPIYDTGTVVSSAIADGANATYSPTGTEIWCVFATTENSCTFALKDTDGNMQMILNETATTGSTVLPQPIYLSASMSLFISNASGSSKTPTFAYYKVSL